MLISLPPLVLLVHTGSADARLHSGAATLDLLDVCACWLINVALSGWQKEEVDLHLTCLAAHTTFLIRTADVAAQRCLALLLPHGSSTALPLCGAPWSDSIRVFDLSAVCCCCDSLTTVAHSWDSSCDRQLVFYFGFFLLISTGLLHSAVHVFCLPRQLNRGMKRQTGCVWQHGASAQRQGRLPSGQGKNDL